jgi:ParB family chromosome partitioning protein
MNTSKRGRAAKQAVNHTPSPASPEIAVGGTSLMRLATPVLVRIPLGSIEVDPERRKALKERTITLLMESIQRRGLMTPIRLCSGSTPETLRLVCGLHRLVAHERLGRTDILAVIVEGDPVELELDEVEENLARQDLTVLERALLERRQRDLYLRLHPETARGVAGGKASQGQATGVSFAEAKAKEEGTSKRTVQRRLQVADAIPEDVAHLIADKPIADNLTQLGELAKQPPEVQRTIATAVAEGKDVREALGTAPKPKAKPQKVEPKVEPVTVSETTRAGLTQDAEGNYTGTTHIMGRDVRITVSASLAYVDLVATVPVPDEPTVDPKVEEPKPRERKVRPPTTAEKKAKAKTETEKLAS